MSDLPAQIVSLPDETIAAMIAGGEKLPLVLATIVRAVEAASPGVICSISLVDPSGTQLLHGAEPSLPPLYNQSVHGLKIGPGIGCCGQAAFTGKRVVVTDVLTHPNWSPFIDLVRLADIRATASEPILASDSKRVLGTVAFYQRKQAGLSDHQTALIEQASALARDAIEHPRG